MTNQTANQAALQYRITVNDSQVIHNEYPESFWTRIAEVAESRGGIEAKLERRTIHRENLVAISKWSTIAELRG